MSEQTLEDREAETPQEATPEAPQDVEQTQEDAQDDSQETFPRSYVERLRNEAKEHRLKATDRDALAARLHEALVRETGRLADPTDLPFDEAHLADAEALGAAVDDLLARKPHLAARTPRGDVGQGSQGGDAGLVDLAGMLRGRA